ncbi:uncharacterized protein ACMZJ9_009969 [Mantella aurantiaca]
MRQTTAEQHVGYGRSLAVGKVENFTGSWLGQGSGLEVTAPSLHNAARHSQVLLPCSFRIEAPPIDPQFLAIIWYFNGEEILRFDSKEKVVGKGLVFDEREARQGNASLTIQNVTIADHGTYRCVVIYSPERGQKEIRLIIHVKPEVRIEKKALNRDGENELYCSISDFFPREVNVIWLRNNIQILNGSKMETFLTNADETYRVNSSIILTPAQIQGHPSIACQVEHVSLQRPVQDVYAVEYGATPKVRLISSKTSDSNELIYMCEAREFSPEPLSINWFVDGKMIDLSRKKVDGVFNKANHYAINLKEGNIPEEIACRVQHETLISPITHNVKVDKYNECTRNCHSGLTGVMAVLLIAALLFIAISGYLIMKKKYLKRFKVSHIHKERSWANEEKVTLYCMALKCPKRVQATWTVTIEGREAITVSDCPKYKDEETGPLLHSDYHVKTEPSEENAFHNVTTKLSFTPSASDCKRTEVKCKFTCGGKVKERSLIFTFEQKKPEIKDSKDSIKVFFDDAKDIVCVANLENFYPRNIQIQWSCGVDQYKDVQSTKEELTYNDKNHTYKAVSECKIPSKFKQDSAGEFKVRVTWKHPSMYEPESREIPLEDIPHRPIMEDIVIPTFLHGTEAKLQCEIRGFSPNNLEVRWLRREAGKPELYAVNSSDKYKIPEIEITQQPDKAYTCTATLIILASAPIHHRSEFICRVTHSSLGTHLEKSTGELNVKGIPEIEIKQIGKNLRANISNFTPNNISVTWSRTKENKLKNYDDKDITVVEEHDNDDGTFTSVRELTVKKHNPDLKDGRPQNNVELESRVVQAEFINRSINKQIQVSGSQELKTRQQWWIDQAVLSNMSLAPKPYTSLHTCAC